MSSMDPDAPKSSADGDTAGIAAPALPDRCTHCRRPFEADESSIVLMRDGLAVAVYHERCHPHYRRSGCSAC